MVAQKILLAKIIYAHHHLYFYPKKNPNKIIRICTLEEFYKSFKQHLHPETRLALMFYDAITPACHMLNISFFFSKICQHCTKKKNWRDAKQNITYVLHWGEKQNPMQKSCCKPFCTANLQLKLYIYTFIYILYWIKAGGSLRSPFEPNLKTYKMVFHKIWTTTPAHSCNALCQVTVNSQYNDITACWHKHLSSATSLFTTSQTGRKDFFFLSDPTHVTHTHTPTLTLCLCLYIL